MGRLFTRQCKEIKKKYLKLEMRHKTEITGKVWEKPMSPTGMIHADDDDDIYSKHFGCLVIIF